MHDRGLTHSIKRKDQNFKDHKEGNFIDFKNAKYIIQQAESLNIKKDCYGPPQCLHSAFKIPQVFFLEKDSFDLFFDKAIETLNKPKPQKLRFCDPKTYKKIVERARKRLHLLDENTNSNINNDSNMNNSNHGKKLNLITINTENPNLSEIQDLFQNIDRFDYY